MTVRKMTSLASAAVVAAAVGGGVGLGLAGTASATGQAQAITVQRADRTAVAYVKAHYRGSCPARVLHNEADVEHGTAVFDVRTVAPNGRVYVVQVARSSGRVRSVDRAENQSGGCAGSSGGDSSGGDSSR